MRGTDLLARRLSGYALLFAGLLACGCSNGGRAQESTRAVEGISELAGRLGNGVKQIDRVSAASDKLIAGTDMARTFEEFTNSVKEVEAAGKRAKARREEMVADSEAYIAKWQQELAKTENPDVRVALETRQENVRANFSRIQSAANQVRNAYTPYLQHIKEIQKALSLDLSAAGVKAMTPAIETSKRDGEALKRELLALQGELRDIAGSMSPTPR